MIILLTNKDDVTVDFVVKELQKRKLEYYRLNTEDIPETVKVDFDLNRGSYRLYDTNKDEVINLQNVTSVYFRRPKISELSSLTDTSQQEKRYLRSELIYTLEGIYKILEPCFWINNVFRVREAENKIHQMNIAREIGFSLSDSIISNNFSSLQQMMIRNSEDCIIKPIKSGHVKDDQNPRIIFTSKVDNFFSQDISCLEAFPVYLQKHIHKSFDIRCIVIGDRVYCAEIDSQSCQDSMVDWRKGKSFLQHMPHKLSSDLERKCLEITKKQGLVYSAIDFVFDENGDYIFLECNPNGQWAWLEMRLGFPISRDIVDLLENGGE